MPKSLGGLGLRSTRFNNIAMMGKLVESLIHDKDQLWVQALSQKYLKWDSVLGGSYKNEDSYIWKGIILSKNFLACSYKPQLGDGKSSLWYENWLRTM